MALDERVPAASGDGSTSHPSEKDLPLDSRPSMSGVNFDAPRDLTDLPGVAAGEPIDRTPSNSRRPAAASDEEAPALAADKKHNRAAVSPLATHVYTIAYLVLCSIFGTLARLGLQALTFYPGAPVSFSSVWPNLAGSLVMGYLAEDRKWFRYEWGTPVYDQQICKAREHGSSNDDDEPARAGSTRITVDLAAAKKAHLATKKTIPLYVGLATGFCGSFTSFSSFIRDIFLATSNDLLGPDVGSVTIPRNGGYSFMALLAVIIGTLSLSLSGLFVGAHIAVALERFTPSLPYTFTRKILDPTAVLLGLGCWLGAVFLTIFPPDRFSNLGAAETWRGRATLSLVFAPLGCLLRFYLSMYLNSRKPSFPMGTFAANVFGTAVLAMAWDLAHVPEGGVIGCQVLQGIEDGFCGALTTVSTWVSELSSLRRRAAYIYGVASVVVAYSLMVAITGGLRWSVGFSGLVCLH